MARWSLVVEDKTDQSLRAFLGQKGAKKGDLSRFVEEAVLEKIFSETVKSIKERNAPKGQVAIMESINAAVKDIRAARS